MKTWRHPQNRKHITYRIAVRGDRATTTGNMCRKFGEIWTWTFWNMRVDRQTKKQTDRHTCWYNTLHTYRSRSNNCNCLFICIRNILTVLNWVTLRKLTDGVCIRVVRCTQDAPWCVHCQRLTPVWYQLADLYANSDDVTVAQIDVTANDVTGVEINAFPTIKLYGKDGVTV